ncbi:unnamed protein product, partial [Mesorhabditis belari]|uniref:Uncharacterized protein n=1 Tax=Mesorhabditis belari TaxID=2138241 RepID=A0AAF3EVX8_9BILA
MFASPASVQHAAVGFALAVLSLFVLAFAVIAVVLVTISNSCFWNSDNETDFFNNEESPLKDGEEAVDIVLGVTPDDASIV